MRYLSLPEILHIHEAIISTSGGSRGIRDLYALESAVNQPRITFNQQELYQDIISKAGSLCFSIVMNHPFIDGNKRTGHAAMETFLILNGHEINASVDEQEKIILNMADGKVDRSALISWLKSHITSAEVDQ